MNPDTAACEAVLEREIAYNVSNSILPSETAVARHILSHRLALASAYDELQHKLEAHPRALPVFLGVVLSVAAHWAPEKLQEAREDRARLEALNARIAMLARELAESLAQRESLHNESGFAANTLYHPVAVIGAASKKNGRFRGFVREPLEHLSTQFDFKYWPSLGDMCASLTDFVLALFAGVDENRTEEHGPIPDDLRLTDETWAALISSALDLPAEQMIGADYIKGVRQRQRLRAQVAP
jgi:hypothetical protein